MNFKVIALLSMVYTVTAESVLYECQQELHAKARECNACAPDKFRLEPALDKIHDLGRQQINETEYEQFMENFCPVFISTTECCTNVYDGFDEDCMTDQRVENRVNFNIMLHVTATYFCDLNSKVYAELIKDDGADCLSDLDNYADYSLCKYDATGSLSIPSGKKLSHQHICRIIQIDNDCAQVYKSCANTRIRHHLDIYAQKMTEKFNCT